MNSPKIPAFSKRLLCSLLFLLVSFGLLFAAQHSASFANWYTEHIYVLLVNVIGRFFGIFPFSFVEMALYGAILFWCGYFLLVLVPCKTAEWPCGMPLGILSGKTILVKQKDTLKGDRSNQASTSLFVRWKNFGLNFLIFASSLFLSYTLCCGINYGHDSFSESADFQISSYSAKELASLCDYLTGEVNRLAPQMKRDSDGVAIIKGEKHSEIPSKAREAMTNLGTIFPEMAGYYPLPKPLMFSYILSIQNLTGVYSPFTIEANYNSDMTDYNQPFTACHELSHLRGFMQEEEANFLAFLACIYAEDASFQYSGYLSGWLYASNQLYHADPDAYETIRGKLDQNALADLRANDAFWSDYDGQVAEVAGQVNDNYLKANGQSDGVASYDRMVDLMMAYYSHLPE